MNLLHWRHLQHLCARPVRVRFAPSPTGHIHLGGLRAALYNYIFAKQSSGKFVLRIEDTDRTRIVPGSADEIQDVLSWAGLEPDESPRLGGPYGPYEQSNRLDLYRERARQLLESGRAYRCFCSPTRLDLLRKFQARNREKTRYDGKCKHLSPAEIQEKLEQTDHTYAIRFSLAEGPESFEDLVFGRIGVNLVEAQESDPIIMKSDGYPTYHFASVVDDHSMRISHVLRGSEWISSTVKHIQLYKALNWLPPNYVHLPLVTMRDGSKMSKRNDHSHVRSWIEAGYQPETLFNFLTNSGGGVPKSKQDSMEFWSLGELIDGFDFKQITSHPGSLDLNRLRIYSAKEIQRTWSHDRKLIMQRYRTMLERKGIEADIDDGSAELIIGRLIDRLTSLDDLFTPDYVFIWRRPELTWSTQDYIKRGLDLGKLVGEVIDMVDSDLDLSKENNTTDKSKEAFLANMKELAKRHELEYSKLMRLVRKLLTNSEQGLPILEICNCLGKDRLLDYLRGGLAYVASTPKP